jgi:hypothetical protein
VNGETKVARDGTEFKPSVGKRVVQVFDQSAQRCALLTPLQLDQVPSSMVRNHVTLTSRDSSTFCMGCNFRVRTFRKRNARDRICRRHQVILKITRMLGCNVDRSACHAMFKRS